MSAGSGRIVRRLPEYDPAQRHAPLDSTDFANRFTVDALAPTTTRDSSDGRVRIDQVAYQSTRSARLNRPFNKPLDAGCSRRRDTRMSDAELPDSRLSRFSLIADFAAQQRCQRSGEGSVTLRCRTSWPSLDSS